MQIVFVRSFSELLSSYTCNLFGIKLAFKILDELNGFHYVRMFVIIIGGKLNYSWTDPRWHVGCVFMSLWSVGHRHILLFVIAYFLLHVLEIVLQFHYYRTKLLQVINLRQSQNCKERYGHNTIRFWIRGMKLSSWCLTTSNRVFTSRLSISKLGNY